MKMLLGFKWIDRQLTLPCSIRRHSSANITSNLFSDLHKANSLRMLLSLLLLMLRGFQGSLHMSLITLTTVNVAGPLLSHTHTHSHSLAIRQLRGGTLPSACHQGPSRFGLGAQAALLLNFCQLCFFISATAENSWRYMSDFSSSCCLSFLFLLNINRIAFAESELWAGTRSLCSLIYFERQLSEASKSH